MERKKKHLLFLPVPFHPKVWSIISLGLDSDSPYDEISDALSFHAVHCSTLL